MWLNSISGNKIIQRLCKIYDSILFDEIQDLAGRDIEILSLLMKSKISIVCCGDSKQATFKTHNAKKYKSKTGRNIWEFIMELKRDGLITVDINLNSRRFNEQICSFANKVFPSDYPITTIMRDITEHDGVFLIEKYDVEKYYNIFHPQVLKYDVKTNSIDYHSINFGACKGETFDRVLIFPNKKFVDFIMKGTALNAPEKYYVAVTRPKYSLAIVLDSIPQLLNGYEEYIISQNSTSIRSLKFIAD